MTRPMPGPPEDCYCRFGNAACQECETHGYPYSWGLCPGCDLHNGRSESHYKHLSDAECAAEYWRAGWIADHDFHDEREADEASTWHRFATHQHANQETPDE